MTRKEHLMVIAEEECFETAQRISKALRFGMDEVQPGQALNNAERIISEYIDLKAMVSMLCAEDATFANAHLDAEAKLWSRVNAKKSKVEHFLLLSEKQGTLTT